IRKHEMMNAGKIIGIRNFYFLDQKDNNFTLDVNEVFKGLWDIDYVKRRLNEIVSQGNYQYIFTLLPTTGTHGHHKGATILALETVKSLPAEKRPVILGCQLLNKDTKFEFQELEGFPITKIKKDAPVFSFDRTQKLGFRDNLTYKIIANWLIAEHKSQGLLQMGMSMGELERFWFYDINDAAKIAATESLFKQLTVVTFKKREY
ncbi:MAG: PIG-L family deacetylase, partial [Acidobacteriota bacterium]